MNLIYKISLPLLFLIQYCGVGAIAQIIVLCFILIELLRGRKLSFAISDTLVFICIFIIFLLKCGKVPLYVNLLVLRSYWGFLIFLIFFKISNYQINYLNYFYLVCAMVIIEFVLINTFVPLDMMKNIPPLHIKILLDTQAAHGGFLRCYGPASNASATATLLVILLCCIYKFQESKFNNKLVVYAALILFIIGSGTGFALFICFLLVKYRLLTGKKILTAILILSVVTIFLIYNVPKAGSLLVHFSKDYFNTLYELKSFQVMRTFNNISHSTFEFLFGLNYQMGSKVMVMSDFTWINFLECYGFLGVFLFLIFVCIKKRFAFLPISLLLIGFFHYPVLVSIPGQFIVGSLLFSHYYSVRKI